MDYNSWLDWNLGDGNGHVLASMFEKMENMKIAITRYVVLTGLIFIPSCHNQRALQQNLIYDVFLEAQADVREVIETIVEDAVTANIEGLQTAHLDSDKFTKFGPRSFERQDVVNTNASEEAFFGTISNYQQEVRDLKIDVFDDMAIATYYPYVSFVQEGQKKEGSGRQTLVFLLTDDGWKIVHEHGTSKTTQ